MSNPDHPSPEAKGRVPEEARSAAPAFERDASASLVAEFRRLAILSGLRKKTKAYKTERRKFFGQYAAEDFEDLFGKNANHLESWRKLCRHLGVGEGLADLLTISPLPQALHGIYVNIVDLVDSCKVPDARPRIFTSEEELAKYISRTGKVFPIDKARHNPLLSQFLIHVSAYRGQGGGGGGRRRRRRKAKAQKVRLSTTLFTFGRQGPMVYDARTRRVSKQIGNHVRTRFSRTPAQSLQC
ncbi:hypothetical protein OH77DRAFT_1403730 [Trametes cingulata]|nr:hypothetical protein OH77DRAFT_1403730 [Trametes cingulata]